MDICDVHAKAPENRVRKAQLLALRANFCGRTRGIVASKAPLIGAAVDITVKTVLHTGTCNFVAIHAVRMSVGAPSLPVFQTGRWTAGKLEKS
jgi:hypothetical protein